MRLLRTLPTRSLLVLIAVVVALVTGGTVVALAARPGSAHAPPPKPLAAALHGALAAPEPQGVTARVAFTNNLFPSGALLGSAGSALLSGASGRLWLRNDGHGRIELQSDSGDVQIVWSPTELSAYDASSNTVYKLSLPQRNGDTKVHTHAPPTPAQISDFLTQLEQHLNVSGASPTSVAGRPAYGVSVAPKEGGSLLGSIRLGWDASKGVPLRIGVYATGSSSPALQLAVKKISYGPVSASTVNVSPPSGAKVVELGSPSGKPEASGDTPKPVEGLDAVRAAAGFDVVAPDTISGLTLTDARLVGGKHVILVYGDGPGAIVLTEQKADTGASMGPLDALPTISLDGATAHELATQLGTVIEWKRAGVQYVLAGSVSSAAAEAAARSVG